MRLNQMYRKIAKKNGVSIADVKRDMQAAIDVAYTNPNKNHVTIAYQNQIPRKGDIPTAEEVIHFAVSKIKQ